MRQIATWAIFLLALTMISACEKSQVSFLSGDSLNKFFDQTESFIKRERKLASAAVPSPSKPLGQIVDNYVAKADLTSDFETAIKSAIMIDPTVVSAKQELLTKSFDVDITKAQKDYKFSGAIYGGIEDITDETAGLALVLNANRLLYDGGRVDSQVLAQSLTAESAQHYYSEVLEERSEYLSNLWIEYERYMALMALLNKRLEVLDPLITQLEQVAEDGVGDVSQVAAAQRTVSLIRVTANDIAERLEQAKVSFENSFGEVPKNINFNESFVENIIPKNITSDLILKSPIMQKEYKSYLAAEADVAVVKAKDNFNLNFEARASRPVGESGFDSDESLGLVLRRTVYPKKLLEAEVKQAEARAEARLAKVQATHKEGERLLKLAQKNIASMDEAISLSIDNAKNTADEIAYLRQQLIIGGSTLDSVLSAEARLYDAESKEINFIAEKRKSQIAVITGLGLFGSKLGILN